MATLVIIALLVMAVVTWRASRPDPPRDDVPGTDDRSEPDGDAHPGPGDEPDPDDDPDADTGPDPDADPDAQPDADGEPDAADEPPTNDDAEERLMLLVAGDEELSEPEQDLRAAMRELGFTVEVVDDEDSDAVAASRSDVVVVSKTVKSEEIADTYLETDTGVVFWEDNAQVIEQGGEEIGEEGGGVRGLATIDLVNPETTSWHLPETDVFVNPDAPAELRAGLEGTVTLYHEPAEMTFAPVQDGRSTMTPSGVWVAEYAEEGDGRFVSYAIEADAGLADGTRSHGRRVYFGLYDETFSLLTADGRALFEAAVLWAAGGA